MVDYRIELDKPPPECISLRVFLLGPVRIEWDWQPLSIYRRQARALLCRLAARMQPVPREELCYAFWPDVPEASAHRCLSHLLSHLRQALPEPDLICSTNELVELDPYRVWSDSCAFRSACSQPDTRPISSLEDAIALYRGPFLSGCSLPDRPEFELWASEWRSSYERMYLDALARLVAFEVNSGDYGRAISYARDYLKVDELAEEMHRRLMVLQIMTGNRPAAVQQYQECRRLLQRELHVDPLPETRAVYEAITRNA